MHKDPIMYRAEACAKILMPERAKLTANMDPAVSKFVTAVKHVVDMLAWLNNPSNLSTGTLLQLSQLATAMAHMDGYSDDLITVMLIEARSQLDQCSDFLTFLGSHSAMQFSPVAQIAAELRTVVALQDQATAQQIQQALTSSQALFSSPKTESFVRHLPPETAPCLMPTSNRVGSIRLTSCCSQVTPLSVLIMMHLNQNHYLAQCFSQHSTDYPFGPFI